MMQEKYYSCQEIEEGLSFREDSIQHCCCLHANGGYAFLGTFDGNLLPIEMILAEKQKLRIANQNSITSCTGCPELIYKEWPVNNFFFSHININDFMECNLTCEYCYSQHDVERIPRTHQLLPLIQNIIDHKYLSPNSTFYWGGGEVTVYKDFEVVSSVISSHGYKQVVNTNAVLYSESIATGLASGLVQVQVSVDSGTAETYCLIKGKNVFDSVWANIGKYAKVGEVVVKYIVQDNNCSDMEIENFVQLCISNGVKHINVVPENNALCRNSITDLTLGGAAKLIWEAYCAGLEIQGKDGAAFHGYKDRLMGLVGSLSVSCTNLQNKISRDNNPARVNGPKTKILFVAYANSTHTHSWIELLDHKSFDVQVFGIENTSAPNDFLFSVFNSSSYFPESPYEPAIDAECLARIITEWQPDIIHSLGLYHASFVCLIAREKYGLQKIGKWIVTARGGPDMTLNRLLTEEAAKISSVLQSCDQFIADNIQNYNYAVLLGLPEIKISPVGIAPGTGGVDFSALSALSMGLPSSRERTVLWPKAYECPASKALPVFEALRLCWKQIYPCTVYMAAVTDMEIRYWFETLPEEIKRSCVLMGRIERSTLLQLMGRSRVLLAPSLSDGIPNTLYEAMAVGAVPVFSPLETIQSVVSSENVIFARNLYPHEIASALVKAMNDDCEADAIACRNTHLVVKIADRDTIKSRVIENYRNLVH